MKPKVELIPGNSYVYWSKGVFEKRASKKECILISLSPSKKWATVRRPDLEVRQIQTVLCKRLQEIPKKKVSPQLSLPGVK